MSDTVVPMGGHAIPCCRDTQHIACMGTKGLAIVFNHLHGNGDSAVYKGVDVSLSLGVDRGSLP